MGTVLLYIVIVISVFVAIAFMVAGARRRRHEQFLTENNFLAEKTFFFESGFAAINQTIRRIALGEEGGPRKIYDFDDVVEWRWTWTDSRGRKNFNKVKVTVRDIDHPIYTISFGAKASAAENFQATMTALMG